MTPRRAGLLAWGFASTLAAATAAAGAAGYRINTTPSVPVGVWRISPASAVARNAVVVICPPDSETFRLARSRGYVPHGGCPGGYRPLFKPAAALAGDVVTVTAEGLAINGVPVPNSRALVRDGAGRAMPRVAAGHYPVAPGTLWLVSSGNPSSFDSRYFGPLLAARVQGIARPVWVGEAP
jgi:conjugative transfer signal peptidase TraF